MKVTDLETFVVANPPPFHGGRYFTFVKLTTDDGLTGIGEVYSVPFRPSVVEAMIADVFARHLEGRDPTGIERLWRDVYAMGYTLRSDLSVMGVLSGLEMACWDIVGKASGRPVYELLGGRVHDRLRSYTYLYPEPGDSADVYLDPDLAATRAVEYVDLGFTAVKFDPVDLYTAYDPSQPSLEVLDRAEGFVKTIRDAVGPGCDLLFGTHGQFTPSGALRVARRIERYDPLWFEEPVPPENVDAMAAVARGTTIPVATGERLATKNSYFVASGSPRSTSSGRCSPAGRRRSSSSTWDGSAGSWRPRRWPPWPRRTTPRWRRTCTRGRSRERRASSSTPARPTSSFRRASAAGTDSRRSCSSRRSSGRTAI